MDKASAKREIDALVEKLCMKEYLSYYPAALSKGTLQRMMLIMNFLRKDENILLDEPFNGLDLVQLQQTLEICSEHVLWILPGIFSGVTDGHIRYIALAANIYFWLKIVNSTQGITMDYQLIQMKRYRNREIARIYANQNTLIQYLISSCIFGWNRAMLLEGKVITSF